MYTVKPTTYQKTAVTAVKLQILPHHAITTAVMQCVCITDAYKIKFYMSKSKT